MQDGRKTGKNKEIFFFINHETYKKIVLVLCHGFKHSLKIIKIFRFFILFLKKTTKRNIFFTNGNPF